MGDGDDSALDATSSEHLSGFGLVSRDATGSGDRSPYRWPTDIDRPRLFQRLILTQATWMVLMALLLLGIGRFSPEGYFIVSFHGLVGVRLLFAPTERPPGWWWKLNWVVYVGFVALVLIIARQSFRLLG